MFSYPKKLQICKTFIESKWDFSNAGALKRIIEAGLVLPMVNPRDFRSTRLKNEYLKIYEQYYSELDCKNYFDWLIGIVAGLEEASPELFRRAVEQLSTFIYHMRPFTVIDKDPFATPTLQTEIVLLRTQLAKLSQGLEGRDNDIVKELTRLNDFLDKYESLFDSLEYEASFGNRVKPSNPRSSSDE